MPLSSEDLQQIATRTLAHYEQHAQSYWEGTRDHDVSQNVQAFLSALRGSPPLDLLDLGCGPGRDLMTFRALGHRAIGPSVWKARRSRPRWPATTAAAKCSSRACWRSTCPHHDRPMSENTVNAALRAMGFAADEVTGHGFRATARTMLAERLGVADSIIEAQLAHSVKDSLGRAYNRTEFVEQRRTMMQAWADYLDRLRTGAAVRALPGRKTAS